MLLCFYNADASSPNGTAHFATRLQSVRGKMWLAPGEYRILQTEYLAWLDVRLKAGERVENMNRELQAAGLFPAWPDTPDEMFNSHAGYLEEIKERQVHGATEVVVIEAGIFKGRGCSNDVTALVYERKSFNRLAIINADPGHSEYAYYLSGLDVSSKNATGRRLVATGWVISNCTSVLEWQVRPDRSDERFPASERSRPHSICPGSRLRGGCRCPAPRGCCDLPI